MRGDDFAEAYANGGLSYVARHIYRKTDDWDLAQEIAQAAWVRCYFNCEEIREPQFVRAYVYKAALNLFVSMLRRKKLMEPEPLDPEMLGYHGKVAEAEIDANIFMEKLLNELQPNVRKIIEMTYEGYESKEIAPLVGLSATGVRAALRRTRERFKVARTLKRKTAAVLAAAGA